MSTLQVEVPDIGDFESVEVIELLVKPGDDVKVEQSLITVESDKASMEIPSSAAGKVVELRVKIGDKVSKGSIVVVLDTSAASAPAVSATASTAAATTAASPTAASPMAASDAPTPPPTAAVVSAKAVGSSPSTVAPAAAVASPAPAGVVQPAHPVPADMHDVPMADVPHASPSVRRFARELGVDLRRVRGSGPKQRITPEDVQAYVKSALAESSAVGSAATAVGAASGGAAGAGLGLAPWPKVDFAKFGPVQAKALSRIRKLSGANLHRNWVMIPHVTNHEDADITDLEALRLRLNEENAKAGIKLTMLAFLIKAVVAALRKFPEFNSSLDGDNLILKEYYHVGFAADTPNGLVVPVIRNADQKGVVDIARETSELAAKAREGKMGMADMQGGTFSISSLGGIGGTSFTPIINAPEVAILGVSRASKKPVWNDATQAFEPRLIMPLSLSYDHRVIDGAAAARFNAYLSQLMADFRRVML